MQAAGEGPPPSFVRVFVEATAAHNEPLRPTAIRIENITFSEEEATVSRIQRIVALAAVGLLGAIGVTGVLAGPGGVLGGGSSDDSSAAAQSGDVQTPDSLVAESGDTPDGETEVVGEVIDCTAGEDTHFKFEQSASEFEVTGTLVSFDGSTVVVAGPEGDVTATVDPDAEIKGDLSAAGTPVKVEGAVLDGGSLVAREIEPACEDEDDADVDEGDVDDGTDDADEIDADVDADDDSDSDSNDVEDDDADDHDDEDDDEDHSGPGGDDDDEHDEEDED